MVFAALLWIGLTGLVMGIRADAWGDPLYPIHEAERKPESSRANYDAGIALLNAVGDDQDWNVELYQRGRGYFARSTEMDQQGIASLVGLLDLTLRVGERPDEEIFNEMEQRLSQNIPHSNLIFSFALIAQDLVPRFTAL